MTLWIARAGRGRSLPSRHECPSRRRPGEEGVTIRLRRGAFSRLLQPPGPSPLSIDDSPRLYRRWRRRRRGNPIGSATQALVISLARRRRRLYWLNLRISSVPSLSVYISMRSHSGRRVRISKSFFGIRRSRRTQSHSVLQWHVRALHRNIDSRRFMTCCMPQQTLSERLAGVGLPPAPAYLIWRSLPIVSDAVT